MLSKEKYLGLPVLDAAYAIVINDLEMKRNAIHREIDTKLFYLSKIRQAETKTE